MTEPYLPQTATAEEAAAWLQAQTGEPWPLPRLIESGLRPHIWLTPERFSPDGVNSALLERAFDNRHEGFLAEVSFAPDTSKIAAARTGSLSITKSPRGEMLRRTPPLDFDIDELRFRANDVRSLCDSLRHGTPSVNPVADAPTAQPMTHDEPARGGAPLRSLSTRHLAETFDGVHGTSSDKWLKKLGDVNNHKWLQPARLATGITPKPSTWCPKKFALLLLERGATLQELNTRFLGEVRLRPWLLDWQDEHRERNAFGK